MGLSSIIRFNIGLLTFVKFVEVLKSGPVKTDLNVFSFFPAWRYAGILKFYWISIYACLLTLWL